MLSRALLGLIGLFHLANGLAMIGDAHAWYEATPGVSQTGPMNHHFIVDIGLVFVASGAGMLAGLRAGRTAAILTLAGATWPALHALFHISEWFADGFPRDPVVAATNALGVVFVGLLGLALAFWQARKEGAV
jgi:hypothetical protein